MLQIAPMRRRLPALNALRAFEAAARHGSFTRAAEELFVTHAAVSRHVRELESWLGGELFVRTGRGVALTEAGRRYAGRLTPLFDGIAEATRDAMIESDSGRITVAAEPAIAARWLVPRLGRFNAAHPEIELSVNPSELRSDFYAGDDDIGLRYGYGDWADVEARLLASLRRFPVCAPKLVAGVTLTDPNRLQDFPLLHENKRGWWQEWLRQAGADEVDPWRGPLFHNHLAIDAAEAGQGFALADQVLATDALKEGWLVRPFDIDVESGDGYWLVRGKGLRESKPARIVREWLTREMAATEKAYAAIRGKR